MPLRQRAGWELVVTSAGVASRVNHLDLIEPADRHEREVLVPEIHQGDVVGDRPRIQHVPHLERLRVDARHLAHVFCASSTFPDCPRRRQVRRERAHDGNCARRLLLVGTSITSTSGVKLDTTNATCPSGRKSSIPGPSATRICAVSRKDTASITET